MINRICPLCKCRSGRVVESVVFEDVWRALEAQWQASISPTIRVQHTPADVCELLECHSCGLQYFSPAISGDAAFYEQLSSSSPTYYCEQKWEFEWTSRIIKPGAQLLDVACGRGAFLRIASRFGALSTGVDTNPEAARAVRAAGMRVYEGSIVEFAKNHRARYDIVTAFQVIEHLDDVATFVSAAFECVRPGGVMILSVPNRDRHRALEFEALDFPPHHLSRWSEDQLKYLAGKLDSAALDRIVKEPLNRSQTIGALRLRARKHFSISSSRYSELALKALSRMVLCFPISLAWGAFQLPGRLNMFGMSLVGVIRKT